MSKSQLAIQLSKLKVFDKPNIKAEQYPTDSEIAAAALWNAHMLNDIEDKIIADLGCGTGILGIGALLLGAKLVYFIDNDKAALDILKQNLAELDIDQGFEIIQQDINEFNKQADIVIMNPPFGTKQEHADKVFLEKAFKTSNIIYSFHKVSTRQFIEAITDDYKFDITHEWKFDMPIKQTARFHKKKIEKIKVICFRLEKIL